MLLHVVEQVFVRIEFGVALIASEREVLSQHPHVPLVVVLQLKLAGTDFGAVLALQRQLRSQRLVAIVRAVIVQGFRAAEFPSASFALHFLLPLVAHLRREE